MGVDGILEYVSIKLQINPHKLFNQIESGVELFEKTIRKYEELILHNLVLNCFNYSVDKGCGISKLSILEIMELIKMKRDIDFDLEKWISERFMRIHEEIFRGSPFLMINEEQEIEVI
jgi:hypothetical protein